MDDFDWAFEETPPRSTDVRRRLVLDHRSYDVTAFDGGGGTVGLRLVGWDAGYVFTELAAEFPTDDATDVANLIASALCGFRGGGAPPPAPPPQPVPALTRDRWATGRRAGGMPPNAGKPWEPQDLELLVSRFREGASIRTLTVELGRTDGAIRQRLQQLGETRPGDPAEDPPPAADQPPTQTD